MKNLELPKDQWAPAWGALFGAIPVIWIFWAPYQHQADAVEWILTGFAYISFLFIYLLYVIFWSKKHIVLGACIAMALLAILFTAYRPSGITFFLFVAAFAPFVVNGRFFQSAIILIGLLLVIAIEWWLFWPVGPMPIVISILSLVLGAGTTFAARQQITSARAHRVDERERIARDLHDILGHTLSIIIVKSELAGRLMVRNPERAQKEINDVEQLSRKALSEVREAISGYRAGDFYAEIERATSTLASANIILEVDADIISLSVTQERELTFVLREAITNIIRHANAKHCFISLNIINHKINLTIQDDGQSGTYQEGSGMQGMRKRITSIGGIIEWNTEQGTLITISLPHP